MKEVGKVTKCKEINANITMLNLNQFTLVRSIKEKK